MMMLNPVAHTDDGDEDWMYLCHCNAMFQSHHRRCHHHDADDESDPHRFCNFEQRSARTGRSPASCTGGL